MKDMKVMRFLILLGLIIIQEATSHGEQPLSRIAIHEATFALHDLAYIKASPTVLGLRVSLNHVLFSFSLFLTNY